MSYKIMFSEITPYIISFLEGLKISLIISTIGMLLGSLIGIVASFGRTSKIYIINKIVNIYVEIFRNSPLLIQMYLLYFGLAQFNVHVPALIAAIVTIVLNNGAYTTVIFQTGISAIQRGQYEAAYALGMNYMWTIRCIVLPQAFRIVIPPLTNQFIAIFLFSSVASTISVNELTYITMNLEAITLRSFEIFITSGVLYLIVTSTISFLARIYENHYKY